MPNVQVLHDNFADSDVTVLAIHVDDRGDPVKHHADKGYDFPTLDGKHMISDYDITRYPTTVVIDGNGNVIHRHTGKMNDEARDHIEQIARDAADG